MSTSIQPNAPFRADIVGSFLRPQAVKDARAAYAAGTQEPAPAPQPAPETFNLMTPRSRCPHCGHQVRWYENIPVLSYVLLLRGRCSEC